LRWMAIGTILPHPGNGPSEKERHAGMFKAHVVGEREGETIRLDVIGEGDPGYLATSRMLAQTAVALACDELSDVYGIVTPGAALGDQLLERLPRVGVRFELRDDA
ncbi:MAG: saccharopine dehydrogenase, partial [Myxococcota bacterium]